MKRETLLKSSAYITSFGLGLFIFSSALAQDAGTVTGVVPCGRIGQEQCGYDDLVESLQNIINLVVTYLIIPIMVLIILRAGVMLIISGDKVAAKNDAKKALGKAFIGLFFVLGAWLIVQSLVTAFGVEFDTDTTDGKLDKPLQILGN